MAITILKPLYQQPPKPYLQKKTTEEARFYKSNKWRVTSERHRRIEPLCRECASHHKIVRGELTDHIIPMKQGGDPFEEHNLQTLCWPCHDRKRKKESML